MNVDESNHDQLVRFVRVPEVTQATRREFRTAMIVAGVPEAELFDRP